MGEALNLMTNGFDGGRVRTGPLKVAGVPSGPTSANPATARAGGYTVGQRLLRRIRELG